MKKKITNKKQSNLTRILLYILLLCGIVLMIYPFVSNYLFEHRQDSIIETIQLDTENQEASKIEQEKTLAEEYNRNIVSEHVQLTDPFIAEKCNISEVSYMSLLNLQENGVMGYIQIPSINVELPIYHGTDETTLENGVGHLEGTSLPVGGESTHTVLTGHTGLNKAKLFTDLTQVKIGDTFILTVLNEKLAYEVDQILIVLPDEVDELAIHSGEDLCTLVTCTPYGINSHRLFVRGHRVPYVEEMETEADSFETIKKSEWLRQYTKAMTLSIFVIIVLIVGSKVYDRKRMKKKQ